MRIDVVGTCWNSLVYNHHSLKNISIAIKISWTVLLFPYGIHIISNNNESFIPTRWCYSALKCPHSQNNGVLLLQLQSPFFPTWWLIPQLVFVGLLVKTPLKLVDSPPTYPMQFSLFVFFTQPRLLYSWDEPPSIDAYIYIYMYTYTYIYIYTYVYLL